MRPLSLSTLILYLIRLINQPPSLALFLLSAFAPFNFAYILPNPRNRCSPPLSLVSLPIGSPFHFHLFLLFIITPSLHKNHLFSIPYFTLFSLSHLLLLLRRLFRQPMSPAPGLTAVSGGLEGKQYPSPVSSHQHVVGDSAAFWDSLRRFHFVMGSKFMIPVIGGKELNLHVLYVEVTRRGGYEKVVAEKKWREVGNVFNFSPTTTSASYVLRKHYSSLLYHYEQVYFFRAKGPLSTPSVAAPPVSCRPEMGIVEYSTQKIRDCPHLPMEAVGTIDGKFDCGYLVSVKLGSEILSGVLYHPEEAGRASTAVPQSSYAIVPYDAPNPTRSGRRRRNRRGRDPSYPKPNRSGYNFYFAEKHFKLKSLYPNREREFTKMIGESWSSLGPEERLVYQNIGLKDKERYKRELKEYKEKLKVNGGGGEH